MRHPRRTIPCGSSWRAAWVKRSNPRTATTQIRDEDEEPTFGHEQGPTLRKDGSANGRIMSAVPVMPCIISRVGMRSPERPTLRNGTREANLDMGATALDGCGQLVLPGHGRDGTHRATLCRSCTPSAAQWRGAGVVTQDQRAALAGGDVHVEVPHQAVKTDAGRVTLVEEAVSELGVAVGVDVREEVGGAQEVDLALWLSPEPASTIRKRSTPAGRSRSSHEGSQRRRPWCSGGHAHRLRWRPRWPRPDPPRWWSRSNLVRTA